MDPEQRGYESNGSTTSSRTCRPFVDDLAEFFGDEFAGAGNLLDQVVQTMQDALMEARACD